MQKGDPVTQVAESIVQGWYQRRKVEQPIAEVLLYVVPACVSAVYDIIHIIQVCSTSSSRYFV